MAIVQCNGQPVVLQSPEALVLHACLMAGQQVEAFSKKWNVVSVSDQMVVLKRGEEEISCKPTDLKVAISLTFNRHG